MKPFILFCVFLTFILGVLIGMWYQQQSPIEGSSCKVDNRMELKGCNEAAGIINNELFNCEYRMNLCITENEELRTSIQTFVKDALPSH